MNLSESYKNRIKTLAGIKENYVESTLNTLLDKISTNGIDNLEPLEKKILSFYSEKQMPVNEFLIKNYSNLKKDSYTMKKNDKHVRIVEFFDKSNELIFRYEDAGFFPDSKSFETSSFKLLVNEDVFEILQNLFGVDVKTYEYLVREFFIKSYGTRYENIKQMGFMRP